MAFQIARELGADVVLLHSIIPTETASTFQLSDTYKYELPADMEATRRELSDAQEMMQRFCDTIKQMIKHGEIPAARFRSEVLEGVPEEVIVQYSRDHAPVMIVMGTRTADKKQTELIGSVTAEVLDSCRVPVFSVPEDVDAALLSRLRKVAFFCNGDQQDILALDSLHRLFRGETMVVKLIRIPSRRERKENPGELAAEADVVLAPLLKYCREHYPDITFSATAIKLDDCCAENDIDLICVPNKKRNLFARVFNPSLAHKILFRADIPMMVIPV
ncbi:MAG: universal stress protein [Muribaculaceae bacterium]|nr:universal stress protein [Muribaculaceae bacterium]